MAHGIGPSDKEPKRFQIPSRPDFGMTAGDAAEVLITASEIKGHKELNKAALKILKQKKKAINDIT